MTSLPDYHRAGSAPSTYFFTPRVLSPPSTISHASASSGRSEDTPSRIPRPKQTFSAWPSHHPQEQQIQTQRNQTGESRLVQEVKGLESFKQRALSAEKELQKAQDGKAELELEVERLSTELNKMGQEIPELRRTASNLTFQVAAVEKEKDEAVGNLTRQLAGCESAVSVLNQRLDSAAKQIKNEISEKDELHAQLNSTRETEIGLERTNAALRTELDKLRSQLSEHDARNNKMATRMNEAENNLTRFLDERLKRQVRDVVGAFGSTFEAIQRQQEDTNRSVRDLKARDEEAWTQSREQHSSIMRQYAIHSGEIDNLQKTSRERSETLETLIATLSEQVAKGNNDSEGKDRHLVARIETMATSLGKLPRQMEELMKEQDQRACCTLEPLRGEIIEALASMNDTCLQIYSKQNPVQQVQPEPTAQPAGKVRAGLVRKNGSSDVEALRWTSQMKVVS